MQQTKLESLLETVMNVMIGFVISYAVGPLYYAYLDVPFSHASNLVITCGFTVLSVARGYAVRRWVNARLHQAAKTLARKITA